MTTVTLTSKGQLVIPKAIRTALHIRSGTRFTVTVDDGRIVLEPSTSKSMQLGDWLPALQVRRSIDDAELLAPVDGYDE